MEIDGTSGGNEKTAEYPEVSAAGCGGSASGDLILVGGLAVGYAAEEPEERPRISREEFMLSAKFEQDSV